MNKPQYLLLLSVLSSSFVWAKNDCPGFYAVKGKKAGVSKLLQQNPKMTRPEAFQALRDFFGVAAGEPYHDTFLSVEGESPVTKTYIEGKLDQESTFTSRPAKEVSIHLSPDFLNSEEGKLVILTDGRTREIEFSGFLKINGQSSQRHIDIVTQQLQDPMNARNRNFSNFDALTRSLHSEAEIAIQGDTLIIELKDKSDPLQKAVTTTIRIRKGSTSKIENISINRADPPSDYYQVTQESYKVTSERSER